MGSNPSEWDEDVAETSTVDNKLNGVGVGLPKKRRVDADSRHAAGERRMASEPPSPPSPGGRAATPGAERKRNELERERRRAQKNL